MPLLPTLVKTWQHDVNVLLASLGSSIADHRQLIRRWKNALVGFASNPWVVAGSSDGATAGMDGVDRWRTPAPAAGTITVVGPGSLVDGETFTISDGTAVVIFHFDVSGTYVPGSGYNTTNVRVDVLAAATASDVRDAVIGAINGASIQVTASVGGAADVALVNDSTTTARNPNQVITETVADAGFTVTGMAGGVNDLIFGLGFHSWIVLRQAGVLTNFTVCLDLEQVDPDSATALVAWNSAFTGGTTSTRPTASGAAAVIVTGAAWGVPTGAFDAVLHASQSTDGQVTRVFWATSSPGAGSYDFKRWVEFGAPRVPVSGWTPAAYATWYAFAAARPTESELAQVFALRAVTSGQDFQLTLTAARGKDDPAAAVFDAPNDLEGGAWELRPAGLASFTPARAGRHGEVYDLWFSHARAGAGPEAGHYFPPGARTFMQLGELTVPWGASGALVGGDVDQGQEAISAPGIAYYGQLAAQVGSDTPDVAGSLADGMSNRAALAPGGRHAFWDGAAASTASDHATAARRVRQTGADVAKARAQVAATRTVGADGQAGTFDAPAPSTSVGGVYARRLADFHAIPQGTLLTVIFLQIPDV